MLDSDDKNDNVVEAQENIHRNLGASLCREKYNKVNGLKNAK
jgi:hypothetical protein